MANKKKKKRKPLIAGGIAAAAAAALYASIFPLDKPIWILLFCAITALAGWVVYTMATGLDTSKKAPVQRPVQPTGNPTVDQLVQQGLEMIAKIREENAQIPDIGLTTKIDQLEDIAHRIFATVADKPEKAPQIRRFMEYYLPTVLKMLTNYRKLVERGVSGENADKMKQTVENAMDVVLDAFKKQHDQLYQSEVLDVTSDVKVLETMLKQDGLLESELHKSGGKAAATQTQSLPY